MEWLAGRSYCASCRDGRLRATRGLELGVLPAECFASFVGGERWSPLPGEAAAHWLAHEIDARALAGQPACAAGFLIRRNDLIAGRQALTRAPRPGDLWVDLDVLGCGVVVDVRVDAQLGLAISIRHLRLDPVRACAEDFYLQLSGRGSFLR